MASIQHYIFKNFLHLGIKIAQNNIKGQESVSIEDTRKGLEKLFSVSKAPRSVRFTKIDCDGTPAEWVTPKKLNNKGVVIYLHGGGYLLGSVSTHSPLIARIAIAAQTKILAVEYRLAPESPYPAALDDTINSYHWLIKQGYNAKNIVIAGDSSGGGLAIATLLKLRDEGITQPAGCACISPWLDLTNTGETIQSHAEKDLLVNSVGLSVAAFNYVSPDKFMDPYVSPLYADLKGLAPIYIHVSGSEALLDDTLRFEKKAKEAGVEIDVRIWHNMLHVWQAFGFLPEARKSIKSIGKYIVEKTK